MKIVKEVRFLRLEIPRNASIVAIISTVVAAIVPMLIPLLLGKIIDTVLNQPNSSEIVSLITAMAVVTVLASAASIVSSRYSVRIGHQMIQQISRKAFDAVIRMPYLTYATIKQGVLISRLTNDVRMIEPLFVEVPATALRGWSALLAASVALALLNPWFLLTFTVIPIKLAMVRYAETRINNTIKNSFEYASKIASIVNESTSSDSISLIRQSGTTELESKSFDVATRASADVASELDFWRASVRTAYDLGFGFILILILIVGAISVSYSQSSVGAVVSAIVYLNLIRQPLNDLVSLRYPMVRASIGLDRICTILRSANTGLSSISSPAPRIARSAARPILEGIDPSVEFRRVFFRYPSVQDIEVPGLSHIEAASGSVGFAGATSFTKLVASNIAPRTNDPRREWAVEDISFTVKKGEMLAVAGSSGAGKSTVIGLVCGLARPTKGQILINGAETRDKQEEEIWDRVALVSQDTYLRDGSLRENLSYGISTVSDEELLETCYLAGLEKTIRNLRDGLGTHVGIRGERLSGGERQRVSIARALLKRSDILVLDEATSHLDAALEEDILKTIDRFRAGAAVIVVAHRPAVLERSDHIVMIEDGRIVEAGGHNRLVAMNGRYAATHVVGSKQVP